MSYICPICLESLSEETLRYICTTSEQCLEQGIKDVRVTGGGAPPISCPICHAAIHVPPANLVAGIYVLHQDCRFSNPYWSNDLQENVSLGTVNGLPQIQAMQDIRGVSPSDREMWFPLSLLQACERTYEGGRKRGALIVLTGATGAGKSSLATMMMSERGWVDMEPGTFGVDAISEFVYEPPTAGDHPQRVFEEWIELVGALHLNVTSWPPQTDPERFPLIRATFVHRNPAPQLKPETGRDSTLVRLSKSARAAVGRVFTDPKPRGVQYPVVFYDNAGELLRKPGRNYVASLKVADAIVVVVDPTTPDFPPVQSGPRNSARGAAGEGIAGGAGSEHLRQHALIDTLRLLREVAAFIDRMGIAGVVPTLHIVVTKCDAYYAGQPNELRSIQTANADESRARLVAILKRSPDSLIRGANGLRGVVENAGLIKSVRFAWIDDLPTAGRQARPEARNLAKVVSDCLAELLPLAED
jgi:hypothetical protein